MMNAATLITRLKHTFCRYSLHDSYPLISPECYTYPISISCYSFYLDTQEELFYTYPIKIAEGIGDMQQ